jgi:hypothetical protein
MNREDKVKEILDSINSKGIHAEEDKITTIYVSKGGKSRSTIISRTCLEIQTVEEIVDSICKGIEGIE